MQSRNSFSPLTKLPPLSNLTSSGFPLLAMNLLIVLRNESVSRLAAAVASMESRDLLVDHPFSVLRLETIYACNQSNCSPNFESAVDL